MRFGTNIPITEQTQVGEARRIANAMADRLGFNAETCGKISIAVTEAATNILIHAKRGEILIMPMSSSRGPGMMLLVLDKGPGMADVGKCLRDGYSTSGTAGNGLGALQRLSRKFDIFTSPGHGTVVLSRFGETELLEHEECSVICLPISGEEVSGDSWVVVSDDDRQSHFMVIDGLGHGPLAADAALAGVECFLAHYSEPTDAFFQRCHDALRRTRGAAMGVAVLQPDQDEVQFSGIGNIAAALLHGDSPKKGLASTSGIVGEGSRKAAAAVSSWRKGGVLILHSDGLVSHWKLDSYPGLLSRDTAVIAGILYRDFSRGRDDTTILVARRMD